VANVPQVAFRWAGEANISIAIDLPVGGEATRMVPKVTDLRVSGVARVLLSPLVNEIPGFGAAVVALRCSFPPFMQRHETGMFVWGPADGEEERWSVGKSWEKGTRS
jgi:hypothetical protein